VAKDTVGSVLSRLKSDGALVYVGERYYEKGQEPKPTVVSGAWGTTPTAGTVI
jgi:hypothetical protein